MGIYICIYIKEPCKKTWINEIVLRLRQYSQGLTGTEMGTISMNQFLEQFFQPCDCITYSEILI